MALINMFGFDHFKQGLNIAATAQNLSSLGCGLSLGVGYDSVPLGTIFSFSNTGNLSLVDMTLSNGKHRTFLVANATSAYMRMSYTSTQLASFARDNKWYGGCRVYVNQAAYTGGYVVAQVRCGPTVVTVTIPAAGIYYVEVEVNWKTNTIITYLNGVVQNTLTGTTYVDPTYVTSLQWYLCPYSQSASGTGAQNGMTDWYFIVDANNDPNPVGARLGPIIVKPLPFSAVANADRFSPPTGQTVLDTINLTASNISLAADVAMATATRIVKTSPHGEIATLSVPAPVETQAIVGVLINAASYKVQAAAAGTQLQVKQGSANGVMDRTVPGLIGAPTGKSFGYTKALDGSAWTTDKVGQVKLDFGSYRP